MNECKHFENKKLIAEGVIHEESDGYSIQIMSETSGYKLRTWLITGMTHCPFCGKELIKLYDPPENE